MQRDELMAKFDSQDADLKEQQKRHKSTLYEMERKVILDKERLRKDVENKLLELSTEFSKTSEIRVAAHTQRLVRENIALNNEMDRMVFTHERIQKENDAMKKKHQEVIGQFQVVIKSLWNFYLKHSLIFNEGKLRREKAPNKNL